MTQPRHRIRGRTRVRVWVTTGIAIVLVAALAAYLSGVRPWAHSGLSSAAGNTSPVAGPSGAGVAVAGASSVTVILPNMKNRPDYKFSATQPSVAASQSLKSPTSVLAPLAPLYDFHAVPATLPPGTQLRFVVQKNLDPKLVFEAYYDPSLGHWVPEPTTYIPATGEAVATVAHFSIHSIFSWGASRVKALLEGAFKNLFGVLTAHASQPQCGPANGVDMHYITGPQSVLSCHDATVVTPGVNGVANLQVKLANNRHYPMDVDSPSSGNVSTDDRGSVAQQIGAALTKFASKRPGHNMTLLTGAALAKIQLPSQKAPFSHAAIETQVDGEAYLCGLLQTAVDEIALMVHLPVSKLTRNLVDGLAGEEALYRLGTELYSPDQLSLQAIKTLGDVGLDALKVAVQNAGTFLAGLVGLVVSLIDDMWQSISGLIDTVSNQSFHRYTFTADGSPWSPFDLHNVDWSRITIPGSWFLGPPTVQLHPEPDFPPVGMAENIPTTFKDYSGYEHVDAYLGSDGPVNVVYGQLGGIEVAAAPVSLNYHAGGTADAQRGMGYLIYKAGSTGPVFVGVAYPEGAWGAAWLPNPHKADHTDLVMRASITGGHLVIEEEFYGPRDIIAGPTGKGETIWSLNGASLTFANNIIQPAAG